MNEPKGGDGAAAVVNAVIRKRALRMPCSACGTILQEESQVKQHSILDVPVCVQCHKIYHLGEFTIGEDGKETYCRWCGDGGDLLCCDLCVKAFCKECISRNFGTREVLRILGLAGVWKCLACNPTPLQDLRRRMACLWGAPAKDKEEAKGGKRKRLGGAGSNQQNESNQAYVIMDDVAKGREAVAIPGVNEFDNEPFPTDFVYVVEPVPGENVHISSNPAFLSCCSCKDNCRDPTVCECAALMGGAFPYNMRGQLVEPRLAVFECNHRCSCHSEGCKNRTVGKGLQLRLEVFRCEERGKGWGIRCFDPIPAGTYITDYIGEILREDEAEKRGVRRGDEYLFTLDMWASDVARYRLEQLGLKEGYEVDGTPPHVPSPPPLGEDELPPELPSLPPDFVGIESLASMGVSVLTGNSPLSKKEGPSYPYPPLGGVAPRALFGVAAAAASSEEDRGVGRDRKERGGGGVQEGKEGELSTGNNHEVAASFSSYHNGFNHDEEEEEEREIGYEEERRSPRRGGGGGGKGGVASSASTPVKSCYLPLDPQERPLCGAHLPPFVSSKADFMYLDEESRREHAEAVVKHTMDAVEKGIGLCVDAKWYGNVARFLNHSCDPNLFKQTVFVDNHDVRVPRVAFFALFDIPAMEELTYDYGYAAGSVEGKTLSCLCGAQGCRRTMY